MSGKRQKNQLLLAFMMEAKGEARSETREGTEPLARNGETKARPRTND